MLFINVVYACLLLGKRADGFSKVWKRARPHVIIGHVTAWGQYVVGLALVLFILAPITGFNELAGPTIAIGFQGGHGTAAGLAANFQLALDFPEGKTIAYSIATLGIVFGTIGGPLLANLLSRRHPVDPPDAGTSDAPEGHEPENFSFPKPWYPYALGDLGGGTATTASGLLLS